MKVSQHPEYGEESEKLKTTIEAVQNELDTAKPPVTAYGADQRAAAVLWRKKLEHLEALKKIRGEPYFGRVDWLANGADRHDVFYVGKHAMPELQVFGWRDTLPSDLYYTGRSKRSTGVHLLKRTFQIRQDRLDNIADEFVSEDRARIVGVVTIAAPDLSISGDELLLELLAEHRVGQLHDIVATIQEEQYQLISSPLERVLVIQGMAGSGKTAIALHRLAYLLYQHEDKGELSRQRVLYLAPNPIFLSYVAQVLPELGERRVPQMTFDDWLVRKLDAKLDYEPEEYALEVLLDPGVPEPIRLMRYRNARNKGSLKMAQVLDCYVQHLADEAQQSLGEFELSLTMGFGQRRQSEPSIICRVSQTEIRDLFSRIRQAGEYPTPLNASRNQFQAQLEQLVFREARQQARSQKIEMEERRVREQISAGVKDFISNWDTVSETVAYRRLLRSPELLHQVGDGLFDSWQLELLHADAPKQGTPFRFSDLSALLYLHLLLEATPSDEMLEHIVVDEAQDITPLQFQVLSRLSRNQSLTIMGDLAQGIYADHGLRRWEELDAIFGKERIDRTTIRRSYRSTQPIIEYSNALLRRAGASADFFAEPLPRSGPAPVEYNFSNETERTAKIIEVVKGERQQGSTTIAIIVQTAAACRELASSLDAAGIENLQVIDSRAKRYAGGLAILPTYLSKGLEFDTVFVADADDTTYPARQLETRLLYVALTRASHRLYVGWIGQVTPLLDSSLPHVHLSDMHEEQIDAQPVTIADFANATSSALDMDVYVEKLASAGKLYLLRDGRIDRTTLAVLANAWDRRSTDTELSAPELDAQIGHAIRSQITYYVNEVNNQHCEALTFLQIVYGLLRNVLRGAGIALDDAQDTDLAEQAVALARFLSAIRTINLGYTVGAMTTERRVLEAVQLENRVQAREQLLQLVAYGMVETYRSGKNMRIRVSYNWIENLLIAALGHTPDQWDADLWIQWPKLPHPVSQQVLASDMPVLELGSATESRMEGISNA